MSNNTSGTAAELLDHIIGQFNLKNDAALSRTLGFAPPVISKMRKGAVPFGAVRIIKLHELTGWSIADIKSRLPAKVARV